jgi:hypothetical protein
MSHHISNEMAYKIGQAQRDLVQTATQRASAEWNYLILAFKSELQAQFENILKDPFNAYIKIPVKDNYNEKHYITKLNDLYSREFQHSLQITDGYYYILLVSPHFSCPDNRPKPVTKLATESSVDVEPEKSYVFSDSEKKKFEAQASLEDRMTPRLGFEGELRGASGEKKNLARDAPFPTLLLQRRPSRMSLPTISARRGADFSFSEREASYTEPGPVACGKREESAD